MSTGRTPRTKTNDKEATAQLLQRLKKGDIGHDTLKQSAIVQSLVKQGLTPGQIASKSKISTAHIYNMIKIQNWPAEVRDILKDETNKIGPSEVLRLSRKLSDKELIEKVRHIVQVKKANPHVSIDSILVQNQYATAGKKFKQEDKEKIQTDLRKLFEKYATSSVTMTKIKTLTNAFTQLAMI